MRPLMAQAWPAPRSAEVANAGLGRPDVLAFWFGESDRSPARRCGGGCRVADARRDLLQPTTWALPELREALRRYTAALHGDPGRAASRSPRQA